MLIDLNATDADEGLNSELAYFFIGGTQDVGPFHIDRDNGTLYLVGELDHESPDTQYQVSRYVIVFSYCKLLVYFCCNIYSSLS